MSGICSDLYGNRVAESPLLEKFLNGLKYVFDDNKVIKVF